MMNRIGKSLGFQTESLPEPVGYPTFPRLRPKMISCIKLHPRLIRSAYEGNTAPFTVSGGRFPDRLTFLVVQNIVMIISLSDRQLLIVRSYPLSDWFRNTK